ncbi:MAG: hypothetical protein KM312_05420 [Hydrogenibacillus schlegelii]|uniref:Uncharacterized protein n=1 Tax=Hydrogenibacillus schlegelii TaxID=1484 RepID=A0A947G802_HYDSH|nr:hypothetical protein [Hydrogenibacillus schlegelii]
MAILAPSVPVSQPPQGENLLRKAATALFGDALALALYAFILANIDPDTMSSVFLRKDLQRAIAVGRRPAHEATMRSVLRRLEERGLIHVEPSSRGALIITLAFGNDTETSCAGYAYGTNTVRERHGNVTKTDSPQALEPQGVAGTAETYGTISSRVPNENDTRTVRVHHEIVAPKHDRRQTLSIAQSLAASGIDRFRGKARNNPAITAGATGLSPSSPPTPPSSTPPSLSSLSLPHSPGKGEERIKNKALTGREEANGFRRYGIAGEGTETEDGTVTVPTPPSQEGIAKTENATASELKVTQKTTNPSQEGDLWSKILSSILGQSIESKNNGGENNCKSSEINAQKNEAQKVNNTHHTRGRTRENHTTTGASVASVVELYHRLCPSLPRVKGLTAERKKRIEGLLKRYGIEAFRTVFEKAEASEFLSGRNGKWRECNLDWLIREENFVRVWEGKYDNRPPKLPKAFQSYLDYLAGKPLTPDDFPPEQARLMREYNIDPNEIFRIPGVGAVGG